MCIVYIQRKIILFSLEILFPSLQKLKKVDKGVGKSDTCL